MTTLLLVDLSSLFWPRWHVRPSDAAGMAIERIRILAQGYDLTIVCCDEGVSFRYDLYSEYKSKREAKPDAAIAMLTRVRADLAEDFPVAACDRFEADDVIATIARHARAMASPPEIVIVSSDKDLCQLVGERARILGHDGRLLGTDDVIAKHGVRPDQIRDLLALTGDASDSIPGGKGIGPKTAAGLLAAHGTLADVYRACLADPERRGARLVTESWPAIMLSANLVTLQASVPIDCEALFGDEGTARRWFREATDAESLRVQGERVRCMPRSVREAVRGDYSARVAELKNV